MLRKGSEQPRAMTARDLKLKKQLLIHQVILLRKLSFVIRIFTILVEQKPSIMHCAIHCSTSGTFI